MRLAIVGENLHRALVRVVLSAERREFCVGHGEIEHGTLFREPKRGPRNLCSYRYRRRRFGISQIHQYHNRQMVIRKRLEDTAEPAPASRMPKHPVTIERSQTRSQSIV